MTRPSTRRRRHGVFAAAIVATVVIVPAQAALAHVELVTSTPAGGAASPEEVTEIVLEFSTPASLANDGIVIYDATATPIPAAVSIISDTMITVNPDEPLGDGVYAVTWAMQAPDAHPTTGGFQFSVDSASHAGMDMTPPADPGVPQADQPGGTPGAGETPAILSQVLPAASPTADLLATLARFLSLGGALIAIGSLAFAVLVFEGSRSEARMIGFWIRRSGLAVAVAVPLEILAGSARNATGGLVGALAPSNLLAATGGMFGIALLLRLAGGVAVVAGTRLVVMTRYPATLPHRAGPVAVLERERLHIAASPLAIAGAGLMAVSFLFDGHTVTARPAALVTFAALSHVVGGSVWVAGVALLARILIGRHTTGVPLEAARLIVPFSTVAGVTVAIIGLAGTALALSIADGLGTFVSTGWGRVLLAKLLLAGSAGAIGAYNHRFVVPSLRNDPGSIVAEASIRRTIRVEAGLLIGVVVATALLVGMSAA